MRLARPSPARAVSNGWNVTRLRTHLHRRAGPDCRSTGKGPETRKAAGNWRAFGHREDATGTSVDAGAQVVRFPHGAAQIPRLFAGLWRRAIEYQHKIFARSVRGNPRTLQSQFYGRFGGTAMGKIIGIDLGTTNSVVAIMEGREPKVIVNEEGARTTPSVVAWDEKNEVLVGQIAKRQAVTNPENTIFSSKRFIGRRFDEVPEEVKRVPYKVVRAKNGDSAFNVRGKEMTPPEVSARVLMKLKKAAEDYLGEKV